MVPAGDPLNLFFTVLALTDGDDGFCVDAFAELALGEVFLANPLFAAEIPGPAAAREDEPGTDGHLALHRAPILILLLLFMLYLIF